MVSREQFDEIARAHPGLAVPMSLGLSAQDLGGDEDVSPFSIYLRLANEPRTFLLESADPASRFGRYSYIGLRAGKVLTVADGAVRAGFADGSVQTIETGDVWAEMARFAESARSAPLPGAPGFAGGVAGFLGYECNCLLEPKLKRPAPKPSAVGIPDACLLQVDRLCVVDGLERRVELIVLADPGQDGGYELGRERLLAMRDKLKRTGVRAFPSKSGDFHATTLTAREEFEAMVAQCAEAVAAGDAIRLTPGLCVKAAFAEDPVLLYRAIARAHPAEFMYYFDFGDFSLAGSSEEILARVEGRRLFARPVSFVSEAAPDPQRSALEPASADKTQKRKSEPLFRSAKERLAAGHATLVDLARNDAARVCKPGSAAVEEKMRAFGAGPDAGVASLIAGELKDGLGAFDALRSAFPAGSLAGAPKIRAMEIVDGLEPRKRGAYGGAAGYVSALGDMGMVSVSRAATVKDGFMYRQCGSAVVLDSDPALEWSKREQDALDAERWAKDAAAFPGPGR